MSQEGFRKTGFLQEYTHKKNVCLSVKGSLQCSLVCVCVVLRGVCVCMCTPTGLHTLLAAAFYWLLHILRKRRAVVTFESEAPASDPKGGAAGGDGGA